MDWMIFCHVHWSLLDPKIQNALMLSYRRGQLEGTTSPSRKWNRLIQDAKDYLEKFDD
jgi:hypothetical protein